MAFLETRYKQKSAIITALIAVVIVWLILTFGLKYMEPPIEYGIRVNFGTTDFGSGNVQPKEALKSMVQEKAVEEPEEPVQEEKEEIIPEEAKPVEEQVAEEVITQNNEEAIAIKKQEEAKKKAEAEAKAKIKRERLEKERAEKEKREAQERQRKEQEAKRKKLDAMMGGLNTKGKATGGEGDDKTPGDKGKITGDLSKEHYGVGGSGSGGNYRLGNRRALAKPKPDYTCNEEGYVYVEISVDKNGKVISARTGAKGTTNSAPCLLQAAKAAALKTKFSADSNAPAKQVGLIIYNFSLSN